MQSSKKLAIKSLCCTIKNLCIFKVNLFTIKVCVHHKSLCISHKKSVCTIKVCVLAIKNLCAPQTTTFLCVSLTPWCTTCIVKWRVGQSTQTC